MQQVAVSSVSRYAVILAVCATLLSGCLTNRTADAGPQVLSGLPEGWQPMATERGNLLRQPATAWTEINIDRDLAPEYLLFFTFDNGQVGALIYDQQMGGPTVDGAAEVSSQPAGGYVPHEVEPSFWMRSDAPDTVGYVAPPGTTITQMRVEMVERYPEGDANGEGTANPNPGEDVPPTNELVIYGGMNAVEEPTVISVLWWRNPVDGYGIAQMEAADGLRVVEQRADDVLRPLQEVVGKTRLSGLLARSVLCSEVHFKRANDSEPADISQPIYQSAVRYAANSGGIVFCDTAPSYPTYPEGVVLAFLQPAATSTTEDGAPSLSLLWSAFGDEQRAALVAMADLDGPQVEGAPRLIVRDLRARASVPRPVNTGGAAAEPATTNVCAEVVTEDGLTLRRLLFDLVHVPMDAQGLVITPDRFVIANITDVSTIFAHCALIIP